MGLTTIKHKNNITSQKSLFLAAEIMSLVLAYPDSSSNDPSINGASIGDSSSTNLLTIRLSSIPSRCPRYDFRPSSTCSVALNDGVLASSWILRLVIDDSILEFTLFNDFLIFDVKNHACEP